MALQLRRLRSLVVALALAVLVVWPFVHRYLQPQYDFDCWKLFGFGMYAAPTPRFYVSIEDPTQPGRVELTPPEESRVALREFGFEAMSLGRFVDADAFARRAIEWFPDAPAIRLRHERTWVRAGTDRVGLWVRYWDVVRNGDGTVTVTPSEDDIDVDWVAGAEVQSVPFVPNFN